MHLEALPVKRRPLFALLGLLVLALGLIVANNSPAEAHHQGPIFPIPRSLYTQELEFERTGEWWWHYRQDCSAGNIYLDIQGAFLDTMWHYNILMPEGDPGDGRMTQANISTCAAAFAAACTSEATACVGSDYPGYPRNCDAKYNGPYMATFYSSDSRESVPKHELQHCMTRRAEDYDDDRTDGTDYLRCIPSISIMGCGPNAPKDYTAFDDAVFYAEHFPQAFTGGVFADDLVWYGSSDSRTTRLAVYYRTYTSYTFWTGQTIDDVCGNPGVCGAFALSLPLGPCTDVLLGSENGLPGSWGRGLQRVGGTACE